MSSMKDFQEVKVKMDKEKVIISYDKLNELVEKSAKCKYCKTKSYPSLYK